VIYSTTSTPSNDRTSQDQVAQQALYRGISHSQGSVCRPLVYSSITNRYSPAPSSSTVMPPIASVVHPAPHFGCPPNSRSSPIPHSSSGYFRDPFFQPGCGQGQQYVSSMNNNNNNPSAVDPNGAYWHTPPSDNTMNEPIPDFLSNDTPFDMQSVGCQVSDDLLGSRSLVYFGTPGDYYHNIPSQCFLAYPFHSSVDNNAPVVLKDAAKLTLPIFDDKKTTWTA